MEHDLNKPDKGEADPLYTHGRGSRPIEAHASGGGFHEYGNVDCPAGARHFDDSAVQGERKVVAGRTLIEPVGSVPAGFCLAANPISNAPANVVQ
ncbi:hypothetical protein CGZ75_07695 [Paenibacillus herberti]|uniref:Uncharacterized protein n=1 Tax=Paenibacillus herberti TaxID=1619309 RepID=A0A229P2S7_9BACL|nr:hypothetical protein CGZ75_07695 [Paenibacillus herberti]